MTAPCLEQSEPTKNPQSAHKMSGTFTTEAQSGDFDDRSPVYATIFSPEQKAKDLLEPGFRLSLRPVIIKRTGTHLWCAFITTWHFAPFPLIATRYSPHSECESTVSRQPSMERAVPVYRAHLRRL